MEVDKHVLVTGATGYIGRNLVHSLVQKGCVVHILTRKKISLFSNIPDIRIIIGDITDALVLPSTIDTIYHCAGVIYQLDEMEKVNVQGTRNIVNIALQNNCKLIYLSSAGIVGTTPATIIDEDTVCNPHNTYEVSKYKAEQIVQEGVKNGLRTHILRPTIIFGTGKEAPEKDSFFQLVKSMRSGVYKNIGHGIYNIVHIDEVVRVLILLDKTDIPFGGVYIVSNSITYGDMDLLVRNLPPIVTKKTRTIPYPVAYVAVILLTFICWATGKKNPLTLSRLRALADTRIYSQKKLMETMQFKNAFPVKTYLKEVCSDFLM